MQKYVDHEYVESSYFNEKAYGSDSMEHTMVLCMDVSKHKQSSNSWNCILVFYVFSDLCCIYIFKITKINTFS